MLWYRTTRQLHAPNTPIQILKDLFVNQCLCSSQIYPPHLVCIIHLLSHPSTYLYLDQTQWSNAHLCYSYTIIPIPWHKDLIQKCPCWGLRPGNRGWALYRCAIIKKPRTMLFAFLLTATFAASPLMQSQENVRYLRRERQIIALC